MDELEQRRQRKKLLAPEDEAKFCFEEFTDWDVDNGVGCVEGSSWPVCIVTDADNLRGIYMTRETAIRLAHEILGCVVNANDSETGVHDG